MYYVLIPRIVLSLHMLFAQYISCPVISSIYVIPRMLLFIVNVFFRNNLHILFLISLFIFVFLFHSLYFLIRKPLFFVLSCGE